MSVDRSETIENLKALLLKEWQKTYPNLEVDDYERIDSYCHLLIGQSPVYESCSCLSDYFRTERVAKVSLLVNCTVSEVSNEEDIFDHEQAEALNEKSYHKESVSTRANTNYNGSLGRGNISSMNVDSMFKENSGEKGLFKYDRDNLWPKASSSIYKTSPSAYNLDKMSFE